jgi:sugar (pentulose or hexulose) kinase
MTKTPVIAIFDVGKTNKKLLLFNEQYKLVYEESSPFEEIKDEDGFPCEDVAALTDWVKNSFKAILTHSEFEVKAVNFSAYGASFVYLDEKGKVLLPLYNYLKPYPEYLQKQFYQTYGGESQLAKQTASPVLGSLNSGMQVYRIKQEKQELFSKIKYALHLPQYLSYILGGVAATDITSIGCHTNLWHFQSNKYHPWVKEEGIEEKFAPLKDGTTIAAKNGKVQVGIGLHDSSAALIPYFSSFAEPFMLLSTGTWCITLNPFNNNFLTDYELHQDCLSYLSFKGNPVKAARLFAGYEHEQQVKLLAKKFITEEDYYKKVKADPKIIRKYKAQQMAFHQVQETAMIEQSKFSKRDLNEFPNYDEAYHQLIADIMEQQVRSTNLVKLGTPVKRIFVDGGFSRNPVYMNLLAEAFPDLEVYAATVPQASAIGAAMAIHQHWNTKPMPVDIINLQLYSAHTTV